MTNEPIPLSLRFSEALRGAADLHAKQVRKGHEDSTSRTRSALPSDRPSSTAPTKTRPSRHFSMTRSKTRLQSFWRQLVP